MSEIRVNRVVAADGSSAPQFPSGLSLATGMGITGSPNITGAAVTFTGALTGTTGTFSGAVNVDATTDSTSATSGALIVDGGLGVAKNVYIGAGLSVAGTLTYEDVTNVDSVGLITAKSGVNVTGGQLQVGVAYSVGAAGVCTAAGFVGPLTGAATQITLADESSDTSCNVVFATAATGDLAPKTGTNLTFNSSTGALTASSFVGNIAGNVTGNLNGTVNTGTQGSITSLGTLTALTVSGDLTLDNSSEAGKDLTWDVSANSLIFNDSVYAKFGSDGDMLFFHDGSNAYIQNTTGTLYIQSKNGENAVAAVPDGATSIGYDGSYKLATTNDGTVTTGIGTFTAGANFDGILSEKFNTTAGKLSDNPNIDLENGMIHYFSTQETTTSTPNIRYNSSKSLNNMLTTGDSVTVTVITTAAAAGYSANWTVDGSAVTEEWNGGSAPAEGGASGYDCYTITLLKTGSGAFVVLGNLSNFA